LAGESGFAQAGHPFLPSGPEALWAGGQRGVIPPLGIFFLPKAGKGRSGGILQIDVVTILKLLIRMNVKGI